MNASSRGMKRVAFVLLTLVLMAGALFVGWTVQRTDREMREDLLRQARVTA